MRVIESQYNFFNWSETVLLNWKPAVIKELARTVPNHAAIVPAAFVADSSKVDNAVRQQKQEFTVVYPSEKVHWVLYAMAHAGLPRPASGGLQQAWQQGWWEALPRKTSWLQDVTHIKHMHRNMSILIISVMDLVNNKQLLAKIAGKSKFRLTFALLRSLTTV